MAPEFTILAELYDTASHSPKFYTRIIVEQEDTERWFVSLDNSQYSSGYTGFQCFFPDITIPQLKAFAESMDIQFIFMDLTK